MTQVFPSFDTLLDLKGADALRALTYLAWSDGSLEPHEIAQLRHNMRTLPVDMNEAMAPWLDAESPPSILDLHRLRRAIARDVDATSDDEPLTHEALAQLVRQTTGLDTRRVQSSLLNRRPAGTHDPIALGGEELQLSQDVRRLLEGKWSARWDAVATLLKDSDFRYLDSPTVEEHRVQVLHWVKHLADAGLGKLSLCPDEGPADLGATIQTMAALSTFDLSLVIKFGVQFGLFGGSIYFLGTEKHHKTYLQDVAAATLLGGFAMTESGHGSNVKEIETTATWDGERKGFVIHTPTRSAYKEWIGNAARDGRMMTVFAQLRIHEEEFGVHAFLVPIRDSDGTTLPNITIEDCGHKMGLNGVDNGRLAFDHVFVPRDHLLDRYAQVSETGEYSSPIRSESARFFTMLGTLVGGRLSVALGAVTAARTALMIAIRYSSSRRQFGPPDADERVILDYPAHQERLMPPLATGLMLHIAMNDLIQRYEVADDASRREVESLAAGMKAMCTWYAIDATQQAREGCGGQGYLSVNRIAQIRRDVDVFATFEGDNVVLMNLLGRNLLTGYAKSFQHDMALTMLKELGRLATQALRERNPIIVRQTDEPYLRSVRFHTTAFELRLNALLASAAKRVKKRTDAGMDPFDAFHDIQDHMLALAQANLEAHVHKTVANWIDKQPPGPARDALEIARQLSAIDMIYKQSAWYQENGFAESQKSRAVRKLRMKLCGEVREHALALADALTHADEALASPIGRLRHRT